MQISAGRSVDTNGARPLEKDPRQDRPRDLIPLSLLQRCLIPAAIFLSAGQLGGGERDFLHVRALGRARLRGVVSGPFISFGWTEEFGSSFTLMDPTGDFNQRLVRGV